MDLINEGMRQDFMRELESDEEYYLRTGINNKPVYSNSFVDLEDDSPQKHLYNLKMEAWCRRKDKEASKLHQENQESDVKFIDPIDSMEI